MGLRDKLEGIKAQKEEKKIEEQSALQAEQVQEQKAAEEQFQQTFQEWKGMTGAVEDFQKTEGAVKAAKRVRKEKAGKITEVLEEIKKERES